MTEQDLKNIEGIYALALERAAQENDPARKKDLCAAVLQSEAALMKFIKEQKEKED